MKKKLIKVKMAIDWTVIITGLGIAGIFAPVILKIFSYKIKKQLNEHEFKIGNHGKRIAKLECDSDGYRLAIVQLSAAIKYLEKFETKIDELPRNIEKGFNEILKKMS